MSRTLDVALSQLGIHEATGHNDGIPAERYMRGDELAWCSGFLLWCNDNSDDPKIAAVDKDYYRCRSVRQFIDVMREKGRFWPAGSRGPQANDVIFFGHTASDVGVVGSHVGIVEKIEGGRIHTVEGNTSNKVARRSYPLGDKTILGYASIG